MKINEIAPLFFNYKSNFVKKSSLSSYTMNYENHLLPYFGNLDSISESIVQDYVLKKIEDGLSQKTIKDTIIVLKMILKYGSKKGLIEYKIFDIVYPSGSGKYKLEVLSIKDTNRLISHLTDHFSFRSLGILISISTGLRIGEVCALTWEDFDLEKGVVKVNKTIQRVYIIDEGKRMGTELLIDTPKTSSSVREIPLSGDLIKIIKPLMKIVNPEYYVLTNDDKPTEPRTYRAYYKELMKRLDLPDLKFHGLRHSFATRCVNANVDIKTVSVLLGHSNITTTLNVYSHPDLEQKKSAIAKMFKTLK